MNEFENVTLWCEDWIEEDGLIAGWGITLAGKHSERSECYVEVQDWDELLSAYKELKHRLDGLEK